MQIDRSDEKLRRRFEAKFTRPADGCWNWTHASVKGRGRLMVNKRPIPAPRVSYLLYCGDIPDGLHVLHRCDNPACVRPDHLWIGTNRDNTADKVAKGRQRNGASPGERNSHAKLSAADVLSIRSSAIDSYTLGHQFGVDASTIQRIKKRLIWRHV